MKWYGGSQNDVVFCTPQNDKELVENDKKQALSIGILPTYV